MGEETTLMWACYCFKMLFHAILPLNDPEVQNDGIMISYMNPQVQLCSGYLS